jgi:hypothetical protein
MAEILEAEVKSNIGEVAQDTDKLNKNLEKSDKGVSKLGVSFGSLAKASGIVFVLNKAFEAFQEVLGQNQKVIDFFNIAMQTTSLAFNDLFKFLDNNIGVITGYLKQLFTDPLGELYKLGQGIQRFFTDRLSSAADVLKAFRDVMTNVFSPEGLAKAMADLGKASAKMGEDMSLIFDEITASVKEYGAGLIDTATNMVNLRKESDLAAVQIQGLIEEYDRQAEKLRQVRDDESKTFAQRIEANEKLGEVLKEQEREMIKLADLRIRSAKLDVEENDNLQNQIALTQTLNDKKGILAQVTGFESEQKTNKISLEKEEKAVAEENAEAQLAAFSGLANALSGLAGDNKELAAAGAIIDTYAGANKAFAQGGVAGFVTGAAIIAAGLANLQKIYATDVGSGGSGGGGRGTAAATPAPQMLSGAFTLGGDVGSTEPIQAYVVADDMTNTQNKLATIRRRATI